MNMHDIVIKITPAFEQKAKKQLTMESLEALFNYLEKYPEQGDVIQGTGGVRKLRWRSGKNNKGKSGGVRVLYHFSSDVLVLLITLYDKSKKEDLTQAERNELKRLIPQLIDMYKED